MTEQMAIEKAIRCVVGACDETCSGYRVKDGCCVGYEEIAKGLERELEEIQQYRAIGTVEEINAKLAELERWHKSEVNPKIKNVFANTSTSICHNCDHKDEYIEELEAEVEELQALKEKSVAKKPIEHNFYDEPHHYLCPNCGNIVDDNPYYCEECGQLLDWE